MKPYDIDVLVTESGVSIQRWRCTATTMPDGEPGVIWRGVAYRLLDGARIDVAPTDEPERVEDPEKPHFALLPGEGATWVLVAGLQDQLQQAVQRLRAAGMAVVRSGRWMGEPEEGQVFDWFVCCDGALTAASVSSVLGAAAAPARNVGQARVAMLEQRVSDLIADLKKAQVTPRLPAPIPAVATPVEPAPSGVELLDALMTIETLRAELHALRERQAMSSTPPTVARLQDELSAALTVLRPDIRLLRDSWRVATGEFRSRNGFWRMIAELPRGGGRPDQWKQVRAVEKWWERHVSQGQDYSGRAYARFLPGTVTWELLLGWKSDQGRDIEWLTRQPCR